MEIGDCEHLNNWTAGAVGSFVCAAEGGGITFRDRFVDPSVQGLVN